MVSMPSERIVSMPSEHVTEHRPLITVTDLAVEYRVGGLRRHSTMTAVNNVSFTVRHGETLGLVGESGSGKSTISRVILGLERAARGSVVLHGPDGDGEPTETQKGVLVQGVFQDSEGALDPRMRVLDAVAEPLLAAHLPKGEAYELAAHWLDRVGLQQWQRGKYPRQLSGGQRQRVSIARAVAPKPRLLVADEPVSSLDVSLQAQLMNIFAELRDELELTMVFISHDLGVVRYITDYVGVMYLGHMVEYGPTETVFNRPTHPYTRALLDSIPDPDTSVDDRFVLIGDIPSAMHPPSGCVFRTRCPMARDVCSIAMPAPVFSLSEPSQWSKCLFVDEVTMV